MPSDPRPPEELYPFRLCPHHFYPAPDGSGIIGFLQHSLQEPLHFESPEDLWTFLHDEHATRTALEAERQAAIDRAEAEINRQRQRLNEARMKRARTRDAKAVAVPLFDPSEISIDI